MNTRVHGRVVVVGADAPIRRDAVVVLEEERIAAIRDAPLEDDGPIYDLVLPGLIDAHSHARGLPLTCHGVGCGPLERFLVELTALTPLDPHDEALVAADGALRSGITALQIIHHSFGAPGEYADHARATAAGCAEVGVRAFIGLALTDQAEYVPAPDGRMVAGAPRPDRRMGPEEFAVLAQGILGRVGRVQFDAVGPVAPQWCSDRALGAIGGIAAPRVHAHLLESRRQRLSMDVDQVRRLDDAGLVRAESSFAHGVWLDDVQIDRMAAAGSVIVHCPSSNARLGVGSCPVRRLLDRGIDVALGIDSHGALNEPDMFAEMRMALSVAAAADAPLTEVEVLRMATQGGARALCRPELGRLRPGDCADVIALNLLGVADAQDPIAHVVRHAVAGNVVARWVGGEPAHPSDAARGVRARLEARLEADAAARAERIAGAALAWEAVDAAWRQLETRAEVMTWPQ